MNLFPAIVHNGENLWVGALKEESYHHIGKTILSAGYDLSSSKGYSTAYISVPNAKNTNGTSYGILHTGNFSSYALPLSGGAMTGNIRYKGTNATQEMIRWIDNTTDSYGNGMAIGYGGITIIGAGECTTKLINDSGYDASNEHVLIGADNTVRIYSNCNGSLSSSYSWIFSKNGTLSLPGAVIHSTSSYGSSLPSSGTIG